MPKATLLNEEQTQAIQHGTGPLLIIAGAGTGKTTVITERIKHLVIQEKVNPSEILALTFTEKAALEMEERVDVAMPYGYTQMWISTFHSFCDRILRSEGIHIGLNPGYTLTSEAESILFLKKHLFELDLNYFRPLGNPSKFLSGLLQHFSRLKDEDISTQEYLEWTTQQKSKNQDEKEIQKNVELAHAYQKYEELKIKEGIMDYGDLIANTLLLFRKRPNVLREYQDRFKYVLVDEFQDTNFAQNQMAILLAGDKKNITVVGDDDQAIYRWRGAAISNMIQFKSYFPDAKIITLTKNYRSTAEILSKSYQLIQNNNPDRLEIKEGVNKKLLSQRDKKSSSIELFFADRIENEAEKVIKKIMELTQEKLQYKDIAILVRANDHAQPFIRLMQRHNIPYQFLGPGRLFHQEEIKDLIAYLKVLYNFEDSISLYRVLSMSIFDIHPRDIASLLNFARRKNKSLFEVVEMVALLKKDEESEIYLRNEVKEKIEFVYSMISSHLKKVPTETVGQIMYYFIQDSGILKNILSATSANEEKKYQNIAKFFEKLKTFEAQKEDASVFAAVEWIDLAMQMGESPLASDTDWSENNAVNILTIHSSKGLEFPAVFLVNLVSGRFPTRERREQIPIPQDLIKEILPTGDYHLQEERRLFYVGMTRAKDYLYFSAANFYGEGKRERKISPYVIETLGEDIVSKYVKEEKAPVAIQQSLLEWAPISLAKKIEDTEAPKKTIPPITYISYSQIQTFEICPLHYKLRYLLKIPGETTSSQSFGTSIHSALRDFYLAFMQDKKTDPKKITTYLKKNWIDEGYQSKVHEKQAFEKAEFIVSNYLKEYFDPQTAKPLAIEVPFNITIKDSTVHPFIKVGGRIDRVDEIDGGKIEILDYKTGSNVPGEKELAKNLQLTMYGFAAHFMQQPPFNRKPQDIVLSLFYLEEDLKLSTVRSLDELNECKEEIFKKIEEIERSDFTCSGSVLCENCEYKMLCSVPH